MKEAAACSASSYKEDYRFVFRLQTDSLLFSNQKKAMAEGNWG